MSDTYTKPEIIRQPEMLEIRAHTWWLVVAGRAEPPHYYYIIEHQQLDGEWEEWSRPEGFGTFRDAVEHGLKALLDLASTEPNFWGYHSARTASLKEASEKDLEELQRIVLEFEMGVT